MVNAIVILFIGSWSAVSIPCEENFILAKNLPRDGTKPIPSLLSLEGSLGRSPPGEAFWPSGTAGGIQAKGLFHTSPFALGSRPRVPIAGQRHVSSV